MRNLTEEGQSIVRRLAERHHVSEDAVETLLAAVIAGRGTQAQFDHPELGGMGQWSSGGMVMVGDMFNEDLKWKVDALCAEVSEALGKGGILAPPGDRALDPWSELGAPTSFGSQNGVRYAVFPLTRRLAVERDGQVTVYDTADHRIAGVSQQQSHGQSLVFTSQHGPVRIEDLQVVTGQAPAPSSPRSPQHEAARPAQAAQNEDVFAKIERLHELRAKDIITEQEFAAKKTDLLSRI